MAAASAGQGGRMTTRVLLVEDNADDAGFVLSALVGREPGDFAVHVEETCQGALNHLTAHPVDVILLDLCLPDRRGLEIMVAVRDAAREAVIIVQTGSQDAKLARACLDAGAQDYLHKDDMDGATLRRVIGDAVCRLNGERNHATTTMLTDYRGLSSRSGAVSAALAGSGPLLQRDPEQFEAVIEAYAELLDSYVDAVRLRSPRPRARMERVAAVIGDQGGGPQDLVDAHVAALERVVTRESESRARVLTIDGRLMALEMMGILVDYYRSGCRGDRNRSMV